MHRRIDEYLLDGSTASDTDRITVTSVMFERNLRSVTSHNFQPNFSILGEGRGRRNQVVSKYFEDGANLEFRARSGKFFNFFRNFSIFISIPRYFAGNLEYSRILFESSKRFLTSTSINTVILETFNMIFSPLPSNFRYLSFTRYFEIFKTPASYRENQPNSY